MSKLKLPKGWRVWCRKAGLRPHWNDTRSQRGRSYWWYLKGKGYVWRINNRGMLQRGDRIEDFDRWALCQIDEVVMPTNAFDFVQAIRLLTAKGERSCTKH
jgi:hypothetical protein